MEWVITGYGLGVHWMYKATGLSAGSKVTHSIRGNRPIARIRILDYTTTQVELGNFKSVLSLLILSHIRQDGVGETKIVLDFLIHLFVWKKKVWDRLYAQEATAPLQRKPYRSCGGVNLPRFPSKGFGGLMGTS